MSFPHPINAALVTPYGSLFICSSTVPPFPRNNTKGHCRDKLVALAIEDDVGEMIVEQDHRGDKGTRYT